MTAVASPQSQPMPLAVPNSDDDLTHVELTHIDKRVENWVRFGRVAHELILDRRRRVFSFRPHSVFAFVRWHGNEHGTTQSRVDIVRAVGAHEPYQTLPFVRPGGDILLKLTGWQKVDQLLRHIDAIEAAGLDPCDVAPDHWRHAGLRIGAGEIPRPYTVERHQAWLKRREIEG